MKKHRITAAVLLLAVMILLVSCNSAVSDTQINTTNITNVTGTDSTEADEISYPYPQQDFGGAELRFLALEISGDTAASQNLNDIYTDGETGEVINDAVYRRNRIVEGKYNVKITMTKSSDAVSNIAKSIKAGDDAYDVVQDKLVFLMSNLATSNSLYNIYDIPNMNLDAPWYDQNVIKDLSINGELNVLGGDMTITDKMGVYALMFNKKMIKDLNLDNPYDLVNNGTWTMDNLYKLVVEGSDDIDGDGSMTKADQWGFLAEGFTGYFMFVGGGNTIAGKDSEDLPHITINNANTASIMDKITTIMYDTESRTSFATVEEFNKTFEEGRGMFHATAFSSIVSFRNMDSDFGIIPFPKYSETQSNYYNTISPWVSRFLCIPVTNTKIEMTGMVLDALFRESTDTVHSAYYDVLLNGKVVRDNESSEMLDLIFSSVIYDIGSVYNWGGSWFMFQSFIDDENKNITSYYEKIENKVEAELKDTIELFVGQ